MSLRYTNTFKARNYKILFKIFALMLWVSNHTSMNIPVFCFLKKKWARTICKCNTESATECVSNTKHIHFNISCWFHALNLAEVLCCWLLLPLLAVLVLFWLFSVFLWLVFLLFIRRFWNQIFTWRSVKFRFLANSHRFCLET